VVVAEARTSFVVASSAPVRQSHDALQLLPHEEERAKKLVAQGKHYLSMGNLPVARQFFERAAGIGYAPGALKLAATFDPAELAQLGVRGAVPDLAEARKWYERARELGAAEAADRLARLTKNY
jgi:TPR repeat protein